MSKKYKLVEGSLQEQFWHSRAKIQVFGGGFANGKTASAVMKGLRLAHEYPGSNGLVARATYPKLIDTIQKVWEEFMPPEWVKSWPKDKNTLTLKNGSTINFRYISQQGKNAEQTTSNLLSATFDWMIVDQIEDPEITEKDFDDLIGRLRGSTVYRGNDPEMPATGPRWFIITCNPTANWVYSSLIKPVHLFQKGHVDPKLIVDPKTGVPMIEVFEGSTYTNSDNLPEDYITGLEARYTGEMRNRFLLGKWGAFQGLIYPDWDAGHHMVRESDIKELLHQMVAKSKRVSWVDGYDYGLAVPTCYGLAFVDDSGNVILCDGFYEKELDIEEGTTRIKRLRAQWGCPSVLEMTTDPDIFKRKMKSTKLVGPSVVSLIEAEGIHCKRGNNDPTSGITKVRSYLKRATYHPNPFTGNVTAAHMYFNSKLAWINDEITNYRWKRNPQGNNEDKPIDDNDHAMDMVKYMLSHKPMATVLTLTDHVDPLWTRWHEYDRKNKDKRNSRRAA